MYRVLLLAVLLCACGEQPEVALLATDIRISEPPPGHSMAAGYMTLTNNTDTEIIITRVSSTAFAQTALHESSIEDGVSRMRPLAALQIAANSSVKLQPGGKHLMLINRNDATDVTLSFYADDAVVLEVTVPSPDRDNR